MTVPGMAMGEKERKSKNFRPRTRLRMTNQEMVAASRTIINADETPTSKVL